MTDTHYLIPSDVGMLRIYLRPRDKAPGSGRFASWGAKPLYRELVLLAKKAGIVNAVAHSHALRLQQPRPRAARG